jgi:hypothetical protein
MYPNRAPRRIKAQRRTAGRQATTAGATAQRVALCVGLWAALAGVQPARAAETNHTGTTQSTRLYTEPDAAAGGGIQGAVAEGKALRHAFAIPTDDPRHVYQGNVQTNAGSFLIRGLPTDRYDLILVFENEFWEGCTLNRGEDSLTDRDRKLIREKIMVSVPFFDTKEIHRCAGTTGREGKARCVLQEVRTRPVTLQDATVHDIQIRSLKLALLEDVGPAGWHLVRTREFLRTEVVGHERKGVLPARYCAKLSGIRVVDTIKDLGAIGP